MDLNKKMFIDKQNLIIKVRNKKGYIYNKNNQKHIFLNEEIINYLLEGSNNKITFLEFINGFQDKSDKDYIKKILELLNTMDLFGEDNKITKTIDYIHIALTCKCNLECKHCCMESSPRKTTNLFLEDWKSVIDKISYLNPKQLIFSGGEPLILDYFKDLILYSHEILPETIFILSTNGTLINKSNIDFLKSYFYTIDISLDGYDKKSTDMIRGDGTFDKVMESIQLLKNDGVNNINLSYTAGDLNQENREKFEMLCNKLAVTKTFRVFSPVGRGSANRDMFLSENKKLPLSIFKMVESFGLDQQYINRMSSVGCNAGEHQIFIDDKGNAYPCPSLTIDKFKITNMLMEDCINKILQFNGGFTLYESIISQNTNCKNCDLNIFCWCCPGNFEEGFKGGDLGYWCRYMKERLSKIIWNEG